MKLFEIGGKAGYDSYGPDVLGTEAVPTVRSTSRVDQLSCTAQLRTEAQEFVPARSVQSDVDPDVECSQLMSVSQDTGSSVVAMDGLKEQQDADIELRIIQSWLEDPATMSDGYELHTYSPEIQHLWAQRQSLEMKEGLLYRRYI